MHKKKKIHQKSHCSPQTSLASMEEDRKELQQEERSGEQRMSVPAFGDWEKYFKDGVVPTYSVDFSKIRENRRQNKSRVSIGNDDELVLPATTDSAVSAGSSGGEPVAEDRQIVPRRPPTGMRKIMSYLVCGRSEHKMVHSAPAGGSRV